MAWGQANIADLENLIKRLEPKAEGYQPAYVNILLEIMRWSG